MTSDREDLRELIRMLDGRTYRLMPGEYERPVPNGLLARAVSELRRLQRVEQVAYDAQRAAAPEETDSLVSDLRKLYARCRKLGWNAWASSLSAAGMRLSGGVKVDADGVRGAELLDAARELEGLQLNKRRTIARWLRERAGRY